MASLRGSLNFVWDITHPLGQGATSMVYTGRNKRTGEEVAVKVFTPSSFQRPFDVQLREYDVMRKLRHENIVRLLAVEDEQNTNHKVLVMELCHCGSLFNMLEDPECAFGLPEDEFILVLKHVAAGVKHLRDQGIVHRDIKPGNILHDKAEDGRSIYKLTDFGAARELEEEETFTSLYGTEEYLHPDVYERAVLRRCHGRQFAVTIDLWSLGVTFYHIATGNLPFRPYGGRKNRETMHQITTQKEPGIISGVQRMEGGKIEWSKELPEICRLSLGLKKLVTPFLAGLLERDPHRTWLFDQFFVEADSIASKVFIDVFCPSICANLKIYLDRSDNLSGVQDLTAEQTEIPANDQLLIYDGKVFSHVVDPLALVSTYPKGISPTQPIFVFSQVEECLSYPLPSVGYFPNFHASPYLDTDYTLAKKCCSATFSILRAVEKIVLRCHLINKAVENYSDELQHRITHLKDFMRHLSQFCQATQKWHENFLRLQSQQIRTLNILLKSDNGGTVIKTLLNHIQETLRTSLADCQSAALKVQRLLEQTSKLLSDLLESQKLTRNWDDGQGCTVEDRCVERASVVVHKIKQIMRKFREDKAKRVLNFNEEQIHKFEKSQLSELCAKASSILDNTDSKTKTQFGAFRQWYSRALQCRKDSHHVEVLLKELSQQQAQFVERLNMLCQKHLKLVDDRLIKAEQNVGVSSESLNHFDNVDIMDTTATDMTSSTSNGTTENGDILKELKMYRSSLEEVAELVSENTCLMHSFQNLPNGQSDGSWEKADIT